MAVRGYILIEAEVGHAKSVGEAVQALNHSDARVASVDTVTGPFVVQEQAPLSARTVMLYFVLTMLAAPRRLDSGNLDRMSQVFSSRRLAPA